MSDAGVLASERTDFLLASRTAWVPGQALTSADLVIEVADSSLETDRYTKAGLYAAAHLPEYWILNLRHRQMEVHRIPCRTLQPPTAPAGPPY